MSSPLCWCHCRRGYIPSSCHLDWGDCEPAVTKVHVELRTQTHIWVTYWQKNWFRTSFTCSVDVALSIASWLVFRGSQFKSRPLQPTKSSVLSGRSKDKPTAVLYGWVKFRGQASPCVFVCVCCTPALNHSSFSVLHRLQPPVPAQPSD